jgi:multicomponent Na+:H+ antiporter subunit C
MLELLSERFIYIPIIVLMMTGLYVVVATGNLVKRLVGLSLFQTAVCLLYIAVAKVFGGTPPILPSSHGEDHAAPAEATAEHGVDVATAAHSAETSHAAVDLTHATEVAHAAIYSNPLPHVLILTAIVVGVATLAVGLALVVRIQEAYGTIEDEALNAADYSVDTGGSE